MNAAIDKEEKKVFLAYLCVCIVWGSTYLAIKIGVSDLPPALFAGIRFVIAGLLMIVFAKVKKLEFPNTIKDIKKISTVGIFLLLGGNGLVVLGEKWIHSGIASLIVAATPLIITIIELFLPNSQKMGTKGWIGLLVGFVGIVLLVLPGSNSGSVNLKGLIFLLLATLCWSIGSIYSKSFNSSGSIIPQIGIQMLAAGIGLCIIGISTGELYLLKLTSKGLGALIYLIFFGSILGYSSYIYVLQKWPAAKAGTYAYVNPIVAVFLGSIVLNEPISITTIISAVIILGGVFLVQTSKSISTSQE